MNCDTQEEIDYYWERLTEGGDAKAQMCGWLKDKFGLSWQIVPSNMGEVMNDPDRKKADRVMKEVMQMKKLDMSILEKAYTES